MDIPVEESWRRIADWTARHAPSTAAAIRPSAGKAEIDRTRDAVGRPLPADLLDWWRLMDGIADADYRVWSPIPPFYRPLPVAEVREQFASLSRFADESCCGAAGAHAAVAGEPTFGFCTATVPICRDSGGDVLVVDLRDGDRRGCIMEWLAEDGYVPTAWAGTGPMLADVADRLDDPAQTGTGEFGMLEWA